MSIKDWISIVFSVCALIISSGTAFLTVVRQVDDVRVVAEEGPWIFVDDAGNTNVWGIQRVTFINAGNRSASIANIALMLVKPQGDTKLIKSCPGDPTLYMNYADQGFVIKPGEIIIRDFNDPIEIAKTIWTSAPDNMHVARIKWYSRDDIALICVALSVITAGGEVKAVHIPKYFSKVSAQTSIDTKPQWIEREGLPFSIVRKTGTIFTQ